MMPTTRRTSKNELTFMMTFLADSTRLDIDAGLDSINGHIRSSIARAEILVEMRSCAKTFSARDDDDA